MSSKINSYFDWNKRFKKDKEKNKEKDKEGPEEDKFNKLGITDEDFKIYFKKWKKENL